MAVAVRAHHAPAADIATLPQTVAAPAPAPAKRPLGAVGPSLLLPRGVEGGSGR